jgi:23S rRNA (guanosine2251-2'-O)-methyltransferase
MRKLLNEELNRLTVEEFRKTPKVPLKVVLDNVRSQNNIGSVFRTADSFRLEGIVLCGITARPPHREIHKTALGATESVDWVYRESTPDAIKELRSAGYLIIVAEQTEGALPLQEFSVDPEQKYALILGHEIRGVDQQVVDLADYCIEIPQYGTKHSLNISVAAGIAIWELFRQMALGA